MLLQSLIASAQDFYYKGYDWEKTPEKSELTEEEKKLDEVFLKRRDCIQLFLMNNNAVEYRLAHKIIQLNTDKGIERFNKYYLNSAGEIRMEYQKARVIKPNGDIIVQNSSDIKEAKDENGDVEYRYFAFEGIEKGSIIEILELGLYPARFTGSSVKLQGSSYYKNLDFEIITPSHLVYASYPVNGAPDFVVDTTAKEDFRRVYIHMENVKPLKKDEWAAYDANLQKVYFKLDKNLATRKANFYTYGDVTHSIHKALFDPLTKKETAKLKKFIKSLDLQNAKDNEDKIRKVENEIKKGYLIAEQRVENGTNLDFILSNKIMTTQGFFKLFINVLKELNQPYELVLTCDRYEDKFLTKYEAYNFLNDYLIYLPDFNKYISEELMNRYGFPPEEFTYQKGLFIREIRIQDIPTGVGEVKDIAIVPAEFSVDKMNVKCSLTENKEEVAIDMERIATGYKALPYQVVMDYLIEDQKKEIREQFLKYIDDAAIVEEMNFENDNTASFGVEPFIGKGHFKSKKMLEKAGDKLLLKAGLLIGPQSELYDRDERVLPVETPHARVYERTIEITIPENYEMKNTSELDISVLPFGQDGSIGFVSSYVLEGAVLKVTVKEWYDSVYFEAKDYKSYESVINAAANFNKITLILQKNSN
ncbi:MAG: hypothetical protein BGO87_00890 [Flavobacteriia bacterium 40-80]|nr:MAG: hypothetical protein BGO87_00890 [Flavobacteriia bacterium 40-80]